MKETFERKYTKEIIKLAYYFPIVGIVGARQVGKTTISKMLNDKLTKKVHYLDLELISDLSKLEKPELYFERFSGQCIIIDEVQRKPDLFPLIRALVDKTGDNCQFIITGSASPELLRQSTESLAGRIAYVQIYPFTFDELPPITNLEQHWFRGGFPKSLFAPNDEYSIQWIDNFIKTYIERDLRLLGLSTEPMLLRRLWSMMAHMHGNVVNYSTLSSSLGIAVNSVRRYIDFFEHAFLIHRLPPYFANIKKRMVKSPKVYISDSGILHRLLGINSFEDLAGHPALGNSWEGYCIIQILSIVSQKYNISFYRTHDGAECDLILSKGQIVKYALEFKYTSSPKLTRGNTEAFQNIGAEKNFIVIPETDTYPIKDNIEVIGLKGILHIIKEG